MHAQETRIVYCQDANRHGDACCPPRLLWLIFWGRLARGPDGYFEELLAGHQHQGDQGERPSDPGLAPQSSHRDGSVRPSPRTSTLRCAAESTLRGPSTVLGGVLPLRVVLPCAAHRRTSPPMGHPEVQGVSAQALAVMGTGWPSHAKGCLRRSGWSRRGRNEDPTGHRLG